MIKITNCKKITIEYLNHDIDSLRTRNETLYPKDELFKSDDEKILILCHTISEGGMGTYYCQQAIFRNDNNQELLLNMNNFWTPNWTKNFNYFKNQCFYQTSITCYDKITKANPIPQIVLDIENQKFCLFHKDDKIHFEQKINWINWSDKIDICETYRINNAM